MTLTPSPSPTGAGEGRVDPGFEPSYSDQRLDTTRRPVRLSTAKRWDVARGWDGVRYRLPLA